LGKRGLAPARRFPAEEQFGLTNQLRRAAVSMSSILAEGCSRSSKVDYVLLWEGKRLGGGTLENSPEWGFTA
jgi:23S rRNA-intervening sequence protein